MQQQSYLHKHIKNNPHILPLINSNKMRNKQSIINKLKQVSEQSLMQQLRDIDQSLNNKNLSYRNGNLFTSQITQRTIAELHSCIKKQGAIMEDGFSLWNNNSDGHQQQHSGYLQVNKDESGNKTKRLSTKLQTLNQKMVKLSLQNVYDYDLKKYMQIMKMNRHRWSLFKRSENTNQESKQTHNKFQTMSKKQSSQLKSIQSSNSSIAASSVLKLSPEKQTQITQKTISISPTEKLSKILQTYNNNSKTTENPRYKHNFKRKVLTQISQMPNPQDQIPQLSKFDIKNMLKKQGDNLIFIWLPPATYPTFYGMFIYAITKKITICRLKKYFLFKRSLNHRLFNSILQEISARQNRYIEGIQIITNKNQYVKIYEPIGWKMKSVEGMDKIRIRYNRSDN